MFKLSSVLFKEILVTLLNTFTLHVAVIPVSHDFTVIVASPLVLAVIFPFSTLTISELLLDHSTFLLVALLGVILQIKSYVSPIFSSKFVLLSDIPVTLTSVGTYIV